MLAVGAAVVIFGPTALAFFTGGYFDAARLIAALAAWALVIVVALTAPRPLPSSTAGRVAMGGFALLVLWTAVSLSWAPLGGHAQDDLQRLLLYLGFFFAATVLLRGPVARRWLEPALVLGAFVVIAYALSERLLPGVFEFARSRSADGRLEQPLSYWNALGLLAAIGFVLSARVAGDPERERLMRGAAGAAGVALGLGVYLSFSRGALAAVAAGVLFLVALAPQGRPQLRAAVVLLVAAGLAAFVASQLSAIESIKRGEQGDSTEGLIMFGVLVALALAAALVVSRRAPERSRTTPVPALPVSRPTAVLTIAGALIVAAALAAAVLEGKPEGISPVQGADPSRLSSIDTNRYRYWEVAISTWADHPLRGVGSGGYEVEWRKQHDRVDKSGDAHSLYLETLAELGVVGFVLLLAFLAGTGAAVVRLHRVAPGPATALAGGMATWAVHAGLDWDWEMPAVTLPALMLGAAAIAWSEELSPSAARREPESDLVGI
ncbi:MAG TPA: O-antigen ligase family protein [Candidatus Limnocylindrales bacterium]